MINFETHSVARGNNAATKRRSRVHRLRNGLVSQTILRSGGTFLRARRRSRHDCGPSPALGGGGLIWAFDAHQKEKCSFRRMSILFLLTGLRRTEGYV